MKLITLTNLSKFLAKCKDLFATKTELSATTTKADNAIKYASVSGNTISLFKTDDGSGTAAFTIDFPAEYFLDQTKTVFVQSFAWSSTLYPGSTNPNLDGKPVMVLAVKNLDGTAVTYSFLDLTYLLNTYTAKAGDGTAVVTISGYEISCNVSVSSDSGNLITKKTDGLYCAGADVSGKADKDTSATAGNFAKFDSTGNPVDSGKKAADFVAAEAGKGLSTNDYTTEEKTKLAGIAAGAEVNTISTIKVDNVEVSPVSKVVNIDLSGKVDKIAGKGLSTNDYTTAEQTKLSGVSTGANKVESSTTNGNIKIDGTETVVYTLPSDVLKTSDIETVTDAEIEALFA